MRSRVQFVSGGVTRSSCGSTEGLIQARESVAGRCVPFGATGQLVADRSGHCNGLVRRQRFVALTKEALDGQADDP